LQWDAIEETLPGRDGSGGDIAGRKTRFVVGAAKPLTSPAYSSLTVSVFALAVLTRL